jgi:hypothetical protein
MATCSPRDVAAMDRLRQACLQRRTARHATQASPPAPITHVDGSGTATGLASRKPVMASSYDGSNVTRKEDDNADA